MRNKQGFTLIEIMVVIVIVGITVGFALLAFGDFGASKRILFAAEQLANNLRLAEQQAILETSTLGLWLDKNSYQILQLQNNTWKQVSNKGIFKLTYFPQNTYITLISANSSTPGMPAVIINASGGITPFTLSFGSNKENKIVSLVGKPNGDLILTQVGTK